MKEKNVLPDWYPADIHQRRLTLAEWAEELKARSFVFELLNDPRTNLEALSKEFISSNFIGFVIQGNRAEHHIPNQAPPVFDISPSEKTEKGELSYSFNSQQFGRGITIPIMINIDHSDKVIEQEFSNWLKHTRKSMKSGDYQKLLFDRMFEGEKMSVNFKPSKNSKGGHPYIEAQTYDWFRYKVLDWIDLKLWGILMDIEYENSFLKKLFLSDNNKEGSQSNIRTTINWAHELLNRLTYDQITASINSKNI